jgi:hypothetical protein
MKTPRTSSAPFRRCNLMELHPLQPNEVAPPATSDVAPGATSDVARRNLLEKFLQEIFSRKAAVKANAMNGTDKYAPGDWIGGY